MIICCSSACQGTASLIAVRVLLGMCEAVIAPSLILITSMWYTKAESTPRYGFWYCGLGAGQIIGGLISFAAQHSTSSFHSWRIMFLVVGLINVMVAVLIISTLPQSPNEALFINNHEKAFIALRLGNDQAGTGEKVFRPRSILKVFVDPQTWLLVLLTICTAIPSGVITTFSAVLISSFGYNSKQSALLNMPSGCVSIFATMASTYAVAKKIPRWLSILTVLIPALIGAALLSFMGTHHQGGALAGIYMVNFVSVSSSLRESSP
jgi:MFS family permease